MLNKLTDFLPSRQGNSVANAGGQDKAQTDIIPTVTNRHRVFAAISSMAFGALYAELIYFAYNYYGSGLSGQTVALAVGGVFLLTCLSFWLSFALPHRLYRPRFKQYSPIIFLMTEFTASVLIVVANTLLTLGVGIYLVNGQLGAVGELLRSLALYSLVAVISFHGLVLFVRYVRYLYEREMHQSYKIVTFAGVSSVVMLLVIMYLLQYDLGRMGGSEPNKDLLSFHLSLRDIWLIVMNIYVLAWHFSRLADH